MEVRDGSAMLRLLSEGMAEAGRYPEFDMEIATTTLVLAIHRHDPAIYVAVDGDRVVGFLSVFLRGYAATKGLMLQIDGIYVTPEYRGSRAAAALLGEISAMATRTGAREVFLNAGHIDRTNARARVFRRFGFEPFGVMLRRAP